MVVEKKIEIQSHKYNEFIRITDPVCEIVNNSGVKEGIAVVITNHTTMGITVNESLECLESDLTNMLDRLVPEDAPYSHARILPTYGSTAGNPTGHLKAHLTGNHCVFRVHEGKLARGDAQEIYMAEFDGPMIRTIWVTVIGE